MDDTIVAISTPAGESGIGIVRMSGQSAFEIADKIFVSKNSQKPSKFKSHTIHFGNIFDGEKKIDEVLLSVMHKPKTYTKEDIIEINCHGGITALKQVLDLTISLGGRLAEPGEFTKRAFLNGRIDLMQAEAVSDIITSRTEESLRVAQRQLSGEISQQIKEIRSSLMEVMAQLEAQINFPEEELEPSKISLIMASLVRAQGELAKLLETADKGLILREGITTVICGKPNVGKSTLMNRFLRQDRVIVTSVPGTTRDSIEEIVNVKGIPIKIVDTAGIIHAEDAPTKESVKKSKVCMQNADLVLFVLDSSDRLNDQDLDIIDIVKDKKTLVVINKTDMPETLQVDEIREHLHNKKIIKISAKERIGLDELEDAIFNMYWSGQVSADNIFISNSRHIEATNKALAFVIDAASSLDEKPFELVAIDIKDAIEALGVITGEVFTQELLDTIFSKFCIGK